MSAPIVLLDPALGTAQFSLTTRLEGGVWRQVIVSNDADLISDAAIGALARGVEVVLTELPAGTFVEGP